jgi:serine/threonine protein kinase
MQRCSVPDASSCVDDEALYALARGELVETELQRIEAHLQGCADCRAVLAEAARALEPAASENGSSDAAGPTNIARYQVVALLGAGAAGVVYRGFDPQLKRAVALKLLRPELHGNKPEQSERLLREAQAMARLSDPHVVAVYDVGLHQGMVYLVMEYVDGHTLSDWLGEAPRTLAEIFEVFADAGRGLSAAHHKGLVHRDFKPENVLVARDGRVRVTDFGLARESEAWLTERQADDQASTELYAPTRGLVGTPAYMAPELFEGGLASARSDQFAFAVALFVAVFGQHPFKAGEGIGLSELITRVRAGTLMRPSLKDASSERLFGVLSRALSPTPGARFNELSELLSALERSQRQRRGSMMLALLGVLALVLLGFWRWNAHHSPSTQVRSSALPALDPVPLAVPVVAASSALQAPMPAPSFVAPLLSAAPATPAEKRRSPKPTDVRYKDWLKDPF